MHKKNRTVCPICHKKISQTLRGIKTYLHCDESCIAWMKNEPKIEYDESYYVGKSKIGKSLFTPLANYFYDVRNSFAEKKYPQLWIEIGAGDGAYLERVHAKRKIGVEISNSGRKIMKQKGLETMTNEQFLKKRNMEADVISFWQVLEHVDNPWDYLEAAKKNIKKNGKIIIGVPNHESFEFYLFGKYWFHLVPQFHIWHFSPKSLKTLLKNADLKIDRSDYWSIEHHLTGILQSFINACAHSDSVLHRLIKRRQDFSALKARDIFWIIFWCTVGLPLVVFFWILGSLFHKSGTFVVVASKINQRG